MSYSFFPEIAWLTLPGRWRMKPLKNRPLVSQCAYVAVPEGMDPAEAVKRLNEDSNTNREITDAD